MKIKFITLILILAATIGVMLMAGCGSNGVSAAPTDQSVSEIGAEKVKEIVIAKVPGAVESNIYEFEREIDDGRIEYEGSLYHDGYKYEFEVDGATGNILKWEIDN